jgi:membrane fusion protein
MMPQHSLFRQEAIEFQRYHRQWGEVALLQPLSIKVLTWFFTVAVALVIVFVSLAQYARKETVVGYLTPTSGTARIFASRQGTIEAVYVEEGQEVQEGQPLLTIATHEVAADGEDINTAKLETLSRQRDLLIQQIAAEEHRTNSERDRLTALIQGLETEITQLEAQIAIQGERSRLTESLVLSAAALTAKGYMSAADRKRRQEAFLEQKQSLSSLSQQLAVRQNQLTDTRYSLEQLPTTMAENIQTRRNNLSDVQQRISETKGRGAYVIRAPTAGRVSSLQATVGRSADPRELQLEIVPIDSALQAALFIPTRAAGFVEVGQHVRILYDAFPYQKFGAYAGRLIKASQTILMSSDVSGPVTLKEPAYKVTAALDRPDVDAYGKKMPLQAGMLLKADVILERRSLLHWLLDPLLSARM